MKKINSIEIEVLRGDFSKVTVDGIIIPQACDHIFENRLNRRLYYCGGENGLCSYEKFAVLNRPKAGSVILTECDGNCKNLLHAVLSSGDGHFAEVQSCFRQAFSKAEEMNLSTLAVIDFLGDANKRLLSPVESAQALLSVLGMFQNDKKIIKEISVILDCSRKEYEELLDWLENYFQPIADAV